MSRGYNTSARVSEAPGAFAIIAVSDFTNGAQDVIPALLANTTVDYFLKVPNTGSQWKVQKTVNYIHPDLGVTETAGIVFGGMDCIQPVYPGVNTVVAQNVYTILNGYLFKATTGGTTAIKFIGFSNFKTVKGQTTADGSVVWTSFGKAALVRVRYANVTSAGPLTPVAQTTELWES
jgi:hypothetical protein